MPYHIILYFTNGYLVSRPTKVVLPLVETIGHNLETFLLTYTVGQIFLQLIVILKYIGISDLHKQNLFHIFDKNGTFDIEMIFSLPWKQINRKCYIKMEVN